MEASFQNLLCQVRLLDSPHMTKEELIQKLKDLQNTGWNREEPHVNADRALLKFINDPEITKEYDEIDKWYA